MQSTRAIAILSLILSVSALGIALVGLSRTSRLPEAQSAAVAAPLLDLQQAVEYANTATTPDHVRDEWLRLNQYQPHTFIHPATGLTFYYPYEFELRTSTVNGGEVIYVEHPATGMAFQFFIQPTDIPVDALIMERLVDKASSIPGRAIIGYNPETTLGEYSQIPVLKMGASDEAMGEYREAWFVHNGHLFQMTMISSHLDTLDAWFNHTVHSNIYFPDSNMIVPNRTDMEGNALPTRNITPGTMPTPEDFL
jgi:hypothetical protein